MSSASRVASRQNDWDLTDSDLSEQQVKELLVQLKIIESELDSFLHSYYQTTASDSFLEKYLYRVARRVMKLNPIPKVRYEADHSNGLDA